MRERRPSRSPEALFVVCGAADTASPPLGAAWAGLAPVLYDAGCEPRMAAAGVSAALPSARPRPLIVPPQEPDTSAIGPGFVSGVRRVRVDVRDDGLRDGGGAGGDAENPAAAGRARRAGVAWRRPGLGAVWAAPWTASDEGPDGYGWFLCQWAFDSIGAPADVTVEGATALGLGKGERP